MEDLLQHIYSHPIDETYIKQHIKLKDIEEDIRSNRENQDTIVLFFKHMLVTHDAFIQLHKDELTQTQDYTFISLLQVFLELSIFFSSINESFASLKGKKVLSVGSNYGAEPLLMRLLGIDAYGIENDPQLLSLSTTLFAFFANKYQQFPFRDSYLYAGNVHEYVAHTQDKYHVIIARNLNPLFQTGPFLAQLPHVLYDAGHALVQWDALYTETEAVKLYAPKKGIVYHEKLRTLLDSLYHHAFISKKPRAMFLYHIAV